MTQPGRCAAAPAGPKQVTANTGEETLSLQNPKFSSFTGTKTTTEQFVAHVSSSSLHTVHLRKKRGFSFREKDIVFSVSASPRLTLTQQQGFVCSASQPYSGHQLGLWALSRAPLLLLPICSLKSHQGAAQTPTQICHSKTCRG